MTTLAERGTIVGLRYRLESILGEGGMAVVWRAVHTETDRQVALKLVRREFVKDEQVREMFVREARVGARIGPNAHIVDFLDAGVDQALEVPFLAMELLDGEALDVLIKRDGPIAHTLAADMLEQLADGLDQAHSAGVFHRDLKPQNLFLSRDKKQRLVLKVLDFGIAKLAESVQQSSTHVGTPAYSAPEQLGPAWRAIAEQKQKTIATQVSGATDVWAMGLVVYEMLTGTSSGSLWGATTLAELPVKIVLEPTPLASVRAGERAGLLPPGFDTWIVRCLDLDATKRYQTAGEAANALIALLRQAKPASPEAASVAPPIPGVSPIAVSVVAPAQPPPSMAAPSAPPQQQPHAHQAAPPTGWQGWQGAPQQPQQGHGQPWPQGPNAVWGQPDPRLQGWAAHWRAEVRVPANPRFYLGLNPFQFLPSFHHAFRDARVPVRDAHLHLAEVSVNDALRSLAGEDRFLVGLLVSPRLMYRAALRSRNASGFVDGLGQMFGSTATQSLGDPVLERLYELRFPTPQEGHTALPFALRQCLVNAEFRGVLELRPGAFVLRRQDAMRFDPIDLDKVIAAATGIYNALFPT